VVEMMAPPAITRQAEIELAIQEVERSLAPDVVHIRYEIGEDWSGQWAVFFRILLTDDAARRRLHEVGSKVEWGLARHLDFPGLGVYPYHNFRSVSEQEAMREPEWA
jgi:hypothetical protein